jgi:hypothetical protein
MLEISQRRFMKGARKLRFTTDDMLSVTINQNGHVNEFSVSVGLLSESPSRVKQPATKFLGGVLVFGLITLVALLVAVFTSNTETRVSCAVLATLFLLPTSLAVSRMLRGTYDLLVFHNRFNGQPVFNMFHDCPTVEACQGFVSELVKRIKLKGLDAAQADPNSIPNQLQGFARLRDQAILSEEEFQSIKSRLLQSVSEAPGKLGF